MLFKKFFKKIKEKKKKGFSLVETLIAITILMLSIAAPLSLATQGLKVADISQKKTVAFYLAQDSMEWVINRKIWNRKDGSKMLNDLDSCIISSGSDFGCVINTFEAPGTGISQNPIGCSDDTCSESTIYKNSSGEYRPNQTGGDWKESIFKRRTKIFPIRIDPKDPIRVVEARVEVEVKWKDIRNEEQVYTLEHIITDW